MNIFQLIFKKNINLYQIGTSNSLNIEVLKKTDISKKSQIFETYNYCYKQEL